MSTETTVAAQLAALPQIPMAELWKLWDEHFPRRPGTWNRDYVTSRVAFKIQERAFGGIDPDIRRKLLRLGESQSAFGKGRGNEVHLMPGTVLMRDWNEDTHRVVVTPEGFYDLGGKVFKSLSAVARHITGTQWSGPAFFGVKRKMQGGSGGHK
ncbi:DUF2924 domain-containing protein [Ferrovum myxofaciens]|uniref:DUF2924 domain-containing protein n=1 Tax=Ferrovum myxofaciens TaxID=416213 RepID=UPI00235662EE|nr:DUF2924 domain-containing protein [Ferrovum myxofaciens]MBU6995856.1 DUF2924 domain-containing protein [Ferrovum myxofaciens]